MTQPARYSAVCAVIAAGWGTIAAATPEFTVLRPTPGYTASAGLAISRDGSCVVGTASAGGQSTGIRWGLDGSVVELRGPPGPGTTRAVGASGDGSLVAGYYTRGGVPHAAVWDSQGVIHDLPNPSGATSSQVFAMGASGVAVGYAAAAPLDFAVRWVHGGAERVGDSPRSRFSVAQAVSDDGDSVCGYYLPTGGAGTRSFLWTATGGFEDLGGPALTTFASALSGDGRWIAGSDSDGGFLWSRSGGIERLDPPAGWTIAPQAFTFHGDLLAGQVNVFGSRHGFIWSRELGMTLADEYLLGLGTELDGWSVTSVTGVSADGSCLSGTATRGIASCAFVVRGVPAPGVLSVVGAFAFAVRRRR